MQVFETLINDMVVLVGTMYLDPSSTLKETY